MPGPKRWRCESCGAIIGQIDRGTLVVDRPGRVVVPNAGDGAVIVIIQCQGCSSPRRWSPRPPGLETKSR